MPVYEYVCAQCGKTTEVLRKMAEGDAPQACVHCGSPKTKRAHSVFAATGVEHAGGAAPAPHHHGGGCGCCSGGGACGMR